MIEQGSIFLKKMIYPNDDDTEEFIEKHSKRLSLKLLSVSSSI